MLSERKKKMKKEFFEKQINLPKPIITKFLCQLDLKDLVNAILMCKQIYFLTSEGKKKFVNMKKNTKM